MTEGQRGEMCKTSVSPLRRMVHPFYPASCPEKNLLETTSVTACIRFFLDLASGSSSRSERAGWRKERTVGTFGPLLLSRGFTADLWSLHQRLHIQQGDSHSAQHSDSQLSACSLILTLQAWAWGCPPGGTPCYPLLCSLHSAHICTNKLFIRFS